MMPIKRLTLWLLCAVCIHVAAANAGEPQRWTEKERLHLVNLAIGLVSHPQVYGAHPWQSLDSERLFELYLRELSRRGRIKMAIAGDTQKFRGEFSSGAWRSDLSPVYALYADLERSGAAISEEDKDEAISILISAIAGLQYRNNVFSVGGKPYSVSDKAARNDTIPTTSSMVGNIAIVRPGNKTTTAAALLPNTADLGAELKALGRHDADAMIVDLRSHPGFGLKDLLALVGLFAGEGPAMQIKAANGTVDRMHSTGKQVWHRPVAVLVDQETASGAEAFAAVLQDRSRALIIGRRTAGDMRIRSNILMSDPADKSANDQVEVTVVVAEVFRLDGMPIDGAGVEPDIRLGPVEAKPSETSRLETISPWPGLARRKDAKVDTPASHDGLSCPPRQGAVDVCLQNAVQAFQQALATQRGHKGNADS